MKLVAKGKSQERCLRWIEANASDALKSKIAALPDGDTYNLGAMMAFMRSEARKLCTGTGGDCSIPDEDGFGILVHYYEDVAPAAAAKAAEARAKQEEAKTRSARKGASDKTGKPAAAAGSSKRRTKKEGRLVSARKGASPGTRSTAEGEPRPSSLSASSAPPPAESTDSAPLTGGGAVSSPDSAAGLARRASDTSLGNAVPESTGGATESGFSFVLFDGGAQ